MPVTVSSSSTKKSLQLTAIVDTGTSVTALAQRHIDYLGLRPIGSMNVNDKDGASTPTLLYRADIILNGVQGIRDWRIMGCPIPGDDMLLGMDILSYCAIQMGPTKDGGFGITIALP